MGNRMGRCRSWVVESGGVIELTEACRSPLCPQCRHARGRQWEARLTPWLDRNEEDGLALDGTGRIWRHVTPEWRAALGYTANNVITAAVATVPSGTLTPKTGSTQQPSGGTGVARTGTVPTYQFSKPTSSSGSISAGGSTDGLASTGGKASYSTPCPSVNGHVYVRDLNGNCVPYGSAGHAFKTVIPNMTVPTLSAAQLAADQALTTQTQAANLAKYGTKYPMFTWKVVNGKYVQTYAGPAAPSSGTTSSAGTGYCTGPVVVKQGQTAGSVPGTTPFNWARYPGPVVLTSGVTA